MTALADRIRTLLADSGDPERAVQQQRYMKSALPFHGISEPAVAGPARPLLAESPLARHDWESTIRDLWDAATHREHWYAALAIARHRHHRTWREDPDALPLFEHLVRTGAWWDLVDETAAHLVGGLLAAQRAEVTPTLVAWAEDDDLWIRRTAILSQLRHRTDTDVDLLRHALDANLEGSSHGSEFFVRKALGWALREYARTDPAWVRAYVAERSEHLSGHSQREALKHLR